MPEILLPPELLKMLIINEPVKACFNLGFM